MVDQKKSQSCWRRDWPEAWVYPKKQIALRLLYHLTQTSQSYAKSFLPGTGYDPGPVNKKTAENNEAHSNYFSFCLYYCQR